MNSFERGHLLGMVSFYAGMWIVFTFAIHFIAPDIDGIKFYSVIGIVGLLCLGWSIKYYKKDFQEWRNSPNNLSREAS